MKWVAVVAVTLAVMLGFALLFIPPSSALTVATWAVVVELWAMTIFYAATVKFERSSLGRAFVSMSAAVATVASVSAVNRGGIVVVENYDRVATMLLAALMVTHVWLHVTMMRIQVEGRRNVKH